MADTTTYRLILIGLGSAGQGLAQILRSHGDALARRYGVELRITAVCTRSRGSLYHADGIDPAALLRAIQDQGHLRDLPGQHDSPPLDTIEQSDADVLVELSPTDLVSGEPATTHIRAALGRGMHAITANKGPIALHLAELRRLAADAGLYLGYEGTVMSGTPALRLGWSDLAGCEINELRGIVNGTTNYILTQMESGMSYTDALAEAQRLGYAEADPTGDVEGYDAAAKAVILANVLMDARLSLGDVERAGITTLTRDTIEAARASNERWKLIARVWRDGHRVRASVQPTRLPISHPLSGASGATNALTLTTDLLGDVTLIGPGAGGIPTGFAVISDILAMHLLWGRQ
ncbi:MAG TPA: homoserine dehydrogenase [Roseiflexaceae bacterium]|nr:homoserine dehydrogenase [Roseiflexaceae bacterium]